MKGLLAASPKRSNLERHASTRKLVEQPTPEHYESYRILQTPCKKFHGEMQMSSREGPERNYENNNVSLTTPLTQILKLCKCCIFFKS